MYDFERLIAALTGHWYDSLKQHDVRFPTSEARKLQLACLFANIGQPVSQDTIEKWARELNMKNDRQPRHLSWDGWYVQTGRRTSTRMEYNSALSHDELMLVSVEMPNPIWLENKLFNDEINQKFPVFYQSIKKWQKRGCAMCGTKGIRLLPYQNVLPSPIEELHVPLCQPCIDWSEAKSLTLEIFENKIVRPHLN